MAVLHALAASGCLTSAFCLVCLSMALFKNDCYERKMFMSLIGLYVLKSVLLIRIKIDSAGYQPNCQC